MKKRRLTLGNVYLFIAFLLMYAPIIVLVVFSFNKGASTSVFTGFSFKWYSSLFADEETMSALKNTLLLAGLSAVISTVIGTAAAVGISYMKKGQQKAVNFITNIPMIPT